MLFSRIVRAAAIVAALAVAGCLPAQTRLPSKQYVALGNRGRYMQDQMTKGALQWAGAFLDDSGGLILYNGKDEAEVRAIAEHDPGVLSGVLAVEWIRPFDLGFDAATGKSPFHAAK